MKSDQFVLAIASLACILLAETASAAAIPTTYVVDEKALKKNAPAGTTVTFDLYSDSTCTTLVDSETENVEAVLLRERIKPLKISGDTTSVKSLVELRHTFTASPAGGSDLYVKAVASVPAAIDTTTTLLGDCQAQEPAGGSVAGPSSGGGAIIPIASGLPVSMTTIPGGMPGDVGLAGFGRSASVALGGGFIDLTGSPGVELNFAFSMPRDGIITAVSAYFSTTNAMALIGTTIAVTATVYCSATPDNIFTAVPGTAVVLSPALSGLVSLGTISSGSSTGLNIPVTAGSRCLMAFASSASGISLINVVTGYASGGIAVE